MAKTFTSNLPSVSTGDVLTATAQNNLLTTVNSHTIPPAVRATSSGTSQSIATGTATAIQFPAEEYDTDSMHNTVTSNTRLTINTAGIYLITGLFYTATAVSGNRYLYINKNGGTYFFKAAATDPTSTASAGVMDTITATLLCADGDYVEMAFFHNTGSSVAVNTSNASWLSATWLGKTS